MAIKNAFIAELKFESFLTKKMLERVPLDNRDWKPHEKSMSIGRLATHIAQVPHWVSDIIHIDDYDFASHPFVPTVAATSEELLKIFEDTLDKALSDLDSMSDEDFDRIWTARMGERIVNSIPKKVAIRGWGLSHLVHHRGQLSVYLRLLNIPVPGMYGPSADEK